MSISYPRKLMFKISLKPNKIVFPLTFKGKLREGKRFKRLMSSQNNSK